LYIYEGVERKYGSGKRNSLAFNLIALHFDPSDMKPIKVDKKNGLTMVV